MNTGANLFSTSVFCDRDDFARDVLLPNRVESGTPLDDEKCPTCQEVLVVDNVRAFIRGERQHGEAREHARQNGKPCACRACGIGKRVYDPHAKSRRSPKGGLLPDYAPHKGLPRVVGFLPYPEKKIQISVR